MSKEENRRDKTLNEKKKEEREAMITLGPEKKERNNRKRENDRNKRGTRIGGGKCSSYIKREKQDVKRVKKKQKEKLRRNIMENKYRGGTSDATTSSALFVHFLLLDGRTD